MYFDTPWILLSGQVHHLPLPPLPPSHPPATNHNVTTVICSYMLETNTDTNKHMIHATDNRTYNMGLTLGYPLLSIKFIFTDLY